MNQHVIENNNKIILRRGIGSRNHVSNISQVYETVSFHIADTNLKKIQKAGTKLKLEAADQN